MNRPSLPTLALIGCLCLIVQACSSVYETTGPDAASTIGQTACQGNLGHYYLPKSLISFVILKSTTTGNGFRYDMKTKADGGSDGLALVSAPDGPTKHCLQFQSNPFYSDAIHVKRTEDGLLQSVYSNVEDQSKSIVENAAQGIGLAVASERANRDFVQSGSETIIDKPIQIDPFDSDVLPQVNKALRDRGYCIYIDPTNDPFVPLWMQNQCAYQGQSHPSNLKAGIIPVSGSAKTTAAEERFGILYRPALSHTLVILKKDDPSSSNPWRVWQREIVTMPNRAPVFVLRVSRGFFTGRKSEITFDRGMLASVKIQKASELKAVSDALVSVVGVVVQIPAKALIIGTTEAENQAALIKANQALLQAYSQLEAEQKKRANLKNGLNEDGSPRASLDRTTQDCLTYADTSGLDNPRAACLSDATQHDY